jgi:hypothetical protein
MDENRHKQRIADKKIASKFKRNPPTALAVVVGKSGLAYRRPEDGVYVLPITALKA